MTEFTVVHGNMEYLSNSPEETQRIAGEFAATLSPGAVVALYGELGAGKTCFVQGLSVALDVDDVVHSPTFTLVNEYAGRLPIYHIDFYRLSDEEEALLLGFDEYVYGEGVTLVEWPERVASLLPDRVVSVNITLGEGEEERRIRIER